MIEHPSNTLYNGECTSLEQALELCEQEFQWELKTLPDFEEGEKLESALHYTLKEIQDLKKEYDLFVESTKQRLMEKWNTREGIAKDIAKGYFTGDYSHLAI